MRQPMLHLAWHPNTLQPAQGDPPFARSGGLDIWDSQATTKIADLEEVDFGCIL